MVLGRGHGCSSGGGAGVRRLGARVLEELEVGEGPGEGDRALPAAASPAAAGLEVLGFLEARGAAAGRVLELAWPEGGQRQKDAGAANGASGLLRSPSRASRGPAGSAAASGAVGSARARGHWLGLSRRSWLAALGGGGSPAAAPVRRLAASAPGAGLRLPGGVAGPKMRWAELRSGEPAEVEIRPARSWRWKTYAGSWRSWAVRSPQSRSTGCSGISRRRSFPCAPTTEHAGSTTDNDRPGGRARTGLDQRLGGAAGGQNRRDSSTLLIRPTLLPSRSSTIAYLAPQNTS